MNAFERFRADVTKLIPEGLGQLLERPPENIDSDLALPCFSLARKEKKNPVLIASEMAKKIKPAGLVKAVGSIGPYVNFYINWEKFGELVLEEVLSNKQRYGSQRIGKYKVMVEFAHPNTHKAFHIGHLRNISLGESLSRILEFSGTKVVRANYQGDIGPHVAKCLWGFINIHKDRAPAKDRGSWLGGVYREASRRFAESEKVQQEVAEINRMLYAGDKKIMPVWKKTRQWSLDYFNGIYRDFGTEFDRFYFETEVEKPGKAIAERLAEKGFAKRSEGAVIMDMEQYGLGVWVLLTKDSISLYSAKDLALAEMQVKEYNPEKIIHVVGSEQTMHFRQLFKALELTNPKLKEKEYHLSYELVNLPSGKMKSREGNVILYEELKEKTLELALKATKEKNPELSGKRLGEIASDVALGAMKYSMLAQSPEKVIVFEWERALDFQGNSAPYIQYTHARASSILRKSCGPGKSKVRAGLKFDASLLQDEKEKNIIKKLAEFPCSVSKAAEDMRPHYIANYAYGLAEAFNHFYQALPVLKADKGLKEARLALVAAAKQVLANALSLLGIAAPEEM